jgi:hypothetical protein
MYVFYKDCNPHRNPAPQPCRFQKDIYEGVLHLTRVFLVRFGLLQTPENISALKKHWYVMAATDNDPAAAASDALSLHTIAGRDDAYFTQEQEDADFALALSLEDDEVQNLIAAHRRGEVESPSGVPPNTVEVQPYRDDPGSDEILPPYYDDPNDVLANSEENDVETPATTSRRRKWFQTLQNSSEIICIWFAIFFFLSVVTLVIIRGAFFLIGRGARGHDSKATAFRRSGSTDNNLKLPKLYPPLEEGASDDCKKTWEKYAADVWCHRMILYPAWDNGDVDEVNTAAADPWAYSEVVCQDYCRRAIRQLENPMRNGCNLRTDRFDLSNYGEDGKAFFDKERVEEGPQHVYHSLIERYDRLCAKPPSKEKSEWGTCAADLWMNWGIVDGKIEANMNGMDIFFEKTSVQKTIKGGRRTGSVSTIWNDGKGEKKEYDVEVPTRNVGPGPSQTDCGYCTLNWLERKMRSFEYGQILDKGTGEALSLADFNRKMESAINRCGGPQPERILREVQRYKWGQLRWWCDYGPCPQQPEETEETRKVLHGLEKDDWPLTEIRRVMSVRNAPKKALEVLHDGLLKMPCHIWTTEHDTLKEIIPNQHTIHHLCSDQCRNAVDRLQQQHGDEFAALAVTTPRINIFQDWAVAMEQTNKTCLNLAPSMVVQDQTNFCAPGYAALGHPEWIFRKVPLSNAKILSAFSKQVDILDTKVPHYVPSPGNDLESQRIMRRKLEESICNGCAGPLLIGENPNWKKRINEFYADDEIDNRKYTKVAKKFYMTCGRLAGMNIGRLQWDKIWKQVGLDRYD